MTVSSAQVRRTIVRLDEEQQRALERYLDQHPHRCGICGSHKWDWDVITCPIASIVGDNEPLTPKRWEDIIQLTCRGCKYPSPTPVRFGEIGLSPNITTFWT